MRVALILAGQVLITKVKENVNERSGWRHLPGVLLYFLLTVTNTDPIFSPPPALLRCHGPAPHHPSARCRRRRGGNRGTCSRRAATLLHSRRSWPHGGRRGRWKRVRRTPEANPCLVAKVLHGGFGRANRFPGGSLARGQVVTWGFRQSQTVPRRTMGLLLTYVHTQTQHGSIGREFVRAS